MTISVGGVVVMTTNNIVIRGADTADAAVIVEFNKAMARETEDRNLEHAIVWEGVKALLGDRRLGFYVVAQDRASIVGSLMTTTEWSDWRNGVFWWIQSVYVHPEYRRRGVYRGLYDFVKERAHSENVCGFRLYVEKDNVRAQQTYRALGMTETVYKMYEELYTR
ncbi:MAG: GNAT family N-acetyltransferase [Gammaproteobacteria bacterium]